MIVWINWSGLAKEAASLLFLSHESGFLIPQ
jgi:hypothetical protein